MGKRITSNGLRALGIVAPLIVALLNPLASLADKPDPGPVHEPQSGPAAWAAAPQVPDNWLAAIQAEIERAEYEITWQEQTYLPDLPAAYQAPNRAENLRTYFSPAGPIIIPRL